MEKTSVILSGCAIALCIRRHARARRISLRLSASRETVIMTLPKRASVEAGIKFLRSREQWVLQNIGLHPTIPFADGTVIPILGQDYTICHANARGVTQLAGNQLLVYGKTEFVSRRVRDFLKEYIRKIIAERAREMAMRMGRKAPSVSIRDTRSRWGSCSAKGNLAFSWRLVFAPPEILDYLIVHEVAHLVEMSHNARFWDLVARFCLHYQSSRIWLRKEGHKLHLYG